MTDRPPSRVESALLEKLLSNQFEGRDDLVTQLPGLHVRNLDINGSLKLLPQAGVAASVSRRIPVEGEVVDTDGVNVHILLHVLEGYLDELEIFREDSQPLRASINPPMMSVLVW
jgi:hypothetical protein